MALRLTPSQKLLLESHGGLTAALNIPVTLRCHFDLDVPALAQAANVLAERHPILRSSVVGLDARIDVSDEIDVDFEPFEASDVSEIDIMAAISKVSSLPLQYEKGMSFRVRVYKRRQGHSLLHVCFSRLFVDDWSTAILLHDLVVLFRAYHGDIDSALPAIPLNFFDYVDQHIDDLNSHEMAPFLTFWEAELRDCQSFNTFPPEFNRPPSFFDRRCFNIPFAMSAKDFAGLSQLAAKESVTVYDVIVTALHALLWRYTTQDDISIASVVPNRPSEEFDLAAGPFASPILLRAKMNGDPTFSSLLKSNAQAISTSQSHGLPLSLILEHLGLSADKSRFPIAQVALSVVEALNEDDSDSIPLLFGADGSEGYINGLRFSSVQPSVTSSPFDAEVTLAEYNGSFTGRFLANSTLFSYDCAKQLCDHFLGLLSSLASEGAFRRVSALRFMSSEEMHALRGGMFSQSVQYEVTSPVHVLLQIAACNNPDGLAVAMEKKQYTFAQFMAYSYRIARFLMASGIGPDDVVPIYLRRGPRTIAAMVGVLFSGAAFAPIDPKAPKARIQSIFEEAAASLILSEKRMAEFLPESSVRVVLLDEDSAGINSLDPAPVQSFVSMESIAYVIFTSGSTGKPKGCAIPHRAFLNHILFHRDYIGLTSSDRGGHTAGGAFDAMIGEVFAPLSVGAPLFIADDETRISPARVMKWVAQNRVTTCFLTTQLAEMFLDEDFPKDFKLRVLWTGGDKLHRGPSADAPYELMNVYGPTETTVYVTCCITPRGLEMPTIGRSVSNVRLYIVDKFLHPVPLGAWGELLIGGENVGRGYVHQPELTKRSFIKSPFRGGEVLYRTGDLVRFRRDGELEFLGRIDSQVKVRGFRIEIGEIESALMGSGDFKEAVVMLREDRPGDKRLVAYVVPRKRGGKFTAAELRSLVSAKLPEYMIPSAFVFLEQLPLTQNQKVDRNLLPPPQASSTSASPTNTIQESLCRIFTEVLDNTVQSLDDSFFHLGGHSLSVSRLVSRIMEEFDVQIPIEQVYTKPSVLGIEELIRSAQAMVPSQPVRLASLDDFQKENEWALSYNQQSLWFLSKLDPTGMSSLAYNISFAARVTSSLDTGALQLALQALIDRHDALRTVYPEQGGKVIQRILEDESVDFSEVDATRWSEELLKSKMLAETYRPFDLMSGPVFRAVLYVTESTPVLLLLVHHIATDLWSFALMARDIGALYSAYASSVTPTLPVINSTYRDFVKAQKRMIDDHYGQDMLSKWRERLSPPVTVLALPTDSPRPALQTFVGGNLNRAVPQDLSSALSALARQHDVTHYVLLLAAFQTLLLRYSGVTDIWIGSPFACRRERRFEDVVGYFVNAAVIRTNVDPSLTFSSLLERTKSAVLDAMSRQDYPFALLVEKLQPARDPSRSPLIDVMFVLQKPFDDSLENLAHYFTGCDGAPLKLGSLGLESFSFGQRHSQYDLTLMVAEGKDGLWLSFQYNVDLFAQDTIARMAENYLTLLKSIVADPSCRLSALECVSPQELELQLIRFNATDMALPPYPALHDLIAAIAETRRDELAIQVGDVEISYGQLLAHANQLARYLSRQGVTRDSVVAVLLGRSHFFYVCVLGIMRTGASYCPLDPKSPPQRIAGMLADAGIKIALSEASLRHLLPSEHITVTLIEEQWREITSLDSTALDVASDPADLAYVIFTSGSTGRPKGVSIPQRGLLNLVATHVKTLDMTAQDRIGHMGGVAFDALVGELWPALAVGAAVIVADDETRVSPSRIVSFIQKHKISVIFLTTQLAEMLLAEEFPSKFLLRALWTGGDKLHRAPAPEVPFRLFNMYGPSETTCYISCGEIPPTLKGTPHIGRCTPNTQLFVLDSNLRPVPIGVFGELFVGGIQLARGYINQPVLTERAFVKSPFAANERLYRTGDLVRYLRTGDIEFHGRIDTQVKIRGFRIELGEIETALLSGGDFKETVVIAREDRPGDKKLVAYLVKSEDGALHTARDIRMWLKGKIPEYMVPSAFVFLDRIPLTANLKVDKTALPPPHTEALNEESLTAPRNSTEESLCSIFASVLNLQRVGVEDSFFDLGGHSLSCTQLCARIVDSLGVHVTVRNVFQTPTVAGLAATITAAKSSAAAYQKSDIFVDGALPRVSSLSRSVSRSSARSAVRSASSSMRFRSPASGSARRTTGTFDDTSFGSLLKTKALKGAMPAGTLDSQSSLDLSEIEVSEREGVVDGPLTFSQSSLWFIEKMAPNNVAYVVTYSARLAPEVDADELCAAISKLVQRHPSLRSTFYERNGVPVQRVASSNTSQVAIIDNSSLSDENVVRHMDEVVHTPFDLAAGPLFRAVVYVSPSKPQRFLLLTAHHIIVDGWSLRILLNDLCELYNTGSSATLKPATPNTALASLAIAQRRTLASKEGERLWRFWHRRLAGQLPVLQLPHDFARPPVQSFEGDVVGFRLSEEVTASLRLLARSSKVTLFTTLLALFEVLLFRYCSQDDFIVGIPAACRNSLEIEELVAHLVNSIPLRCHADAHMPFSRLLEKTHRRVVSAIENQDFPFALLVELLQKYRDTSRSPIFQVMFSLETTANPPTTIAPRNRSRTSLKMDEMSVIQRVALFDLVLLAHEGPKDIEMVLQYNTKLFDRTTVVRMASHLTNVAKCVTADVAVRLDQVALLSEEERSLVEAAFNDTALPSASTKLVHQLFEQNAFANPTATAVVDSSRHLTYRQLNRSSNAVATMLVERGLAKGQSVAVLVERSAQMVVAMMAILKAKGVYIPIDPKYPTERIAFILEDSGAQFVLTDALIANSSSFPPVLIPLILLDEDDVYSTAHADFHNDANPVKFSIQDVNSNAYIVYTSGNPKGVVVTHRGLANVVAWARRHFSFSLNDRFSQVITPGFDPVGLEVWPALSSGASLHVVPHGLNANVDELLKWLVASSVTVCLLPTPLLEAVFRETLPQGHKLRILYGGGDVLHVVPAAFDPQVRYFNLYGPSEATICVTCQELSPDTICPPPIGKPVDNTRIYILNSSFDFQPIGVYGNLFIAGVQLAAGYINKPDLTSSSFVVHPTTGERLYNTRDVARWRADGSIDFLGRSDSQVKIRGFRVEIQEIEAVLGQYCGVSAAVVVVRELSPGEKRLCAFIVPADPSADRSTLTASIRGVLKRKLPEYLIPTYFAIVTSLPLTANGKVDKGRLLALPVSHAPEAEHVEPEGDVETKVGECFKAVLGVTKVGAHDNFFEMGGHSLSASQLTSRIRQAFGVDITLAQLFDSPTVGDLAALIRRSLGRESTNPDPGHADPVKYVDIIEEAQLDPSITSISGSLCRSVGEIHCLVRASSADAGRVRLRQALSRLGMSHDDFDDRVAAVCGDLSLPLLGVGPDSFGRLSKEIDLIVHCGTLVHAIYNYRKLKAPNVGGTVEVLRLATSFRPKHVVHISTLSVFPLLTRAQLSNGKRPVYTEDMIPSSFEALHDGYAQSKFVAELVALEARRRGVSVSIVRPGRISGGVGDGGGNTDDFISILIKGCIQLGMWPDLDWDIDLIPANVCAKVVMHTAEAQMSGRTDLIVHAVNRKHLIPLRQLVLNLRKFGFTVNEMPYNVWRASVAAAGDDNALTPLLAALPVDKADMIDNETAPVFDDAMEQSLASEVLNSAVVTDELLTSYLKWFVDRGFLPRPAKADEDVFQMDMEG